MPEFILQIYQLINSISGIILFLLIPALAIIILIRGFATWRQTNDWESVFGACESLLKFMLIIVIAFSVLNTYDWIRASPIGNTLPDIRSQINQIKKP